jgi:hypothetical protein
MQVLLLLLLPLARLVPSSPIQETRREAWTAKIFIGFVVFVFLALGILTLVLLAEEAKAGWFD